MSFSKRAFEAQERSNQEALPDALANLSGVLSEISRIEYLSEIEFETLEAWTRRLRRAESQIKTIIEETVIYA